MARPRQREVQVRHLSLLCIPLLLAWSEPAPAQGAQDSVADRQAAPLCYRARPKPACSAFILTDFGGYLVLGGDESNDTPLREVADWGVMANVSARDALGASVFASLDRLGFALGPAVRYRRWLSSSASLDLAVGTPLVRSSDAEDESHRRQRTAGDRKGKCMQPRHQVMLYAVLCLEKKKNRKTVIQRLLS